MVWSGASKSLFYLLTWDKQYQYEIFLYLEVKVNRVWFGLVWFSQKTHSSVPGKDFGDFVGSTPKEPTPTACLEQSLHVYGSIHHLGSDDIFFFNRKLLYSNFSGAVDSARWSCHITVVKELCLSLLCFLGGLYVLLIPLRICLEQADHNL